MTNVNIYKVTSGNENELTLTVLTIIPYKEDHSKTTCFHSPKIDH